MKFTSKAPHIVLLILILIIAAGLRFYKLDAQSLWYDEGNSARIAERSLQLIVEGAAGDIHPPLYYIVLKFWRALFGGDEAALRSFSAVCGVLTVLFAYLIGRDLFGRRTGLIAAWLLAVAPFAVYYSQEARMYALLALCAAASTWALVKLGMRDWRLTFLNSQFFPRSRLAESPTRSGIAESGIGTILNATLYVAATAAGLYTQYAYVFVMIAQGVLYFGLRIAEGPCGADCGLDYRLNRKSLGLYVLMNLVAIALFLPWLPITIRQVTGWSVERTSYQLGEALLDAYRTPIVGRTLPLDRAALPMGLFTAFAILGLIMGGRATLMNRLAVLVLAALPLALLFVFNLYRDAYLKFLLVCVLPLCLLAARGVEAISDWLWVVLRGANPVANYQLPMTQLLITLILAATFIPSLRNLYDNPAYARDDYRGIQRMIAAGARPTDAVLFVAPNQWEVYTYYQRDDTGLYPLQYRPASYDDVARQLQAIMAEHQRLFALFFAERDADPNGWYELWLSGNAHKVHEEWIGNIRLAVYAPIPSGPEAWTVQSNTPTTFGEDIELVGVKAAMGDVKVGDIILAELSWQTQAMLDARYKIFVHVGPDDGPPIAQNDSEPVAGYRPTHEWRPDETIVDRRGVWLKSGTPAGKQGVFVGLYDSATGDRLPVVRDGKPVGDRLKIGEITITDR